MQNQYGSPLLKMILRPLERLSTMHPGCQILLLLMRVLEEVQKITHLRRFDLLERCSSTVYLLSPESLLSSALFTTNRYSASLGIPYQPISLFNFLSGL